MTQTTTSAQATAAVIVAAGRGNRAGGDMPKQWQMLRGQSVAARTVAAFAQAPEVDHIVMVLHPQEMDRAQDFPGVIAVPGGDSRSASVRAGLEALDGHGIARVLIHDVARPLVSPQIIADVLGALDTHGGAAPALAVTDALWLGREGLVTGTQDRSGLYRAQTPQGFEFEAILEAHRGHFGEAADDVEVARAAGIAVAMVPGDERNIKLTWPADFDRAGAILGDAMEIRIGNGYDVHSFGPGEAVVLCGVAIPHTHGLTGHSDADVAMHAVTDAIYGALAEGDIGRHFPPSEAKWKGADSAIFLRHAVDLAKSKGYGLSNVDVTLICELPKIGPHAGTMQAKMAEIMGCPPNKVSVKATTSEKLGFTGRQEGIAAQASACLVKR